MRIDVDIEETIDRYGDVVLRACSAYLRHQDAEDVFQDTFLKYATHEQAFNGEDHRKAWLIRVAVNLSKDRLRSSSGKTVSLDQVPEATVDADDDTAVERMHIRQAMACLSDDQRLALMLSAVEGYTVPEIAQIMGKPHNTVYSHIRRGKKKLEKVLAHDRA